MKCEENIHERRFEIARRKHGEFGRNSQRWRENETILDVESSNAFPVKA